MALSLIFKRTTNLFAYPTDIVQVKISVCLTRRTYANKRQFCRLDCFDRISSSSHSLGLDSCGDNLTDFRFYDWRITSVDQVYLGLDRIDVGRIGAFEAQLLSDLKSREPSVMESIRTDLEIKPDTEKKLTAFMDNFAKSFS